LNRTAITLALLGGAGALVYYLESTGKLSSLFDPTEALAQAIATAEGFYVDGSRPQRNHNPGDMTADLIGRAIGTDGPFVVYSNDDDGWTNLKAQIAKWFDGSSANADSSSTIEDLSGFYTANDQQSWAQNVASALGVSVNTPISQIGG
jgi:hypothetical protein